MAKSAEPFLILGYRAIGAALAIGLMEIAARWLGEPAIRVPFVTSIVLVTALPDSEAARPRAIIGGHLLSALSGFVCSCAVGDGELASAIAVGCATLIMSLTRSVHPPAGIDAFLFPSQRLSPGWIVEPVLCGAVLLALYAALWREGEHRLRRKLKSSPMD